MGGPVTQSCDSFFFFFFFFFFLILFGFLLILLLIIVDFENKNIYRDCNVIRDLLAFQNLLEVN